jgi:2,5-dihydroxypyridine 5,6-dioxygenase
MSYGRLISTPAAATELVDLFKRQLQMCALRAGELCVVVTDTAYNPVYAAACAGAAQELGADVYQMVMSYARPVPDKSLAAAWKEANLLVYATTHTLHYSPAMAEALDHGLRALAAMNPIHVLHRFVGDPEVKRRTVAGARLLDRTRKIRIVSDAGSDLVMDKGRRPVLVDYSYADEKGHLDFWGSGMVEVAQLEGTTEGKLVLDTGDSIFALGRYVAEPVTLTFREGRAVDIRGGIDAFMLREFLTSYDDPNAFMAGHTSWGADKRAVWVHQAIQFPEQEAGGADIEAFYGNIQVEIGSNCDIRFQGKNATRAHVGLCMRNSSLYLDDQLVIDHGRFVPAELQ